MAEPKQAAGPAVDAWRWACRRGAAGVLALRLLALLLAGGALACAGPSDEGLPPDVQDPKEVQNAQGAMKRYYGALTGLPEALDWTLTHVGILTDELANLRTPQGLSGAFTPLDSRRSLAALESNYSRWHRIRGQTREARGFLQAYAPDSATLIGHLYAVEGYAELFLAELFCSGIPLSTVDFNGDYTFAKRSTTGEVLRHARDLLDSAFALTSDSARLQHLAAVGRGRALLALGEYAAAAAAVAAVPDHYEYQAIFRPLVNGAGERLLATFVTASHENYYGNRMGAPSVGNGDGQHGPGHSTINFLAAAWAGDPRVQIDTVGADVRGDTLYFLRKYPKSGGVTLTLASGVEARLIEAEAALQANPEDGQWLAKLNYMRQAIPVKRCEMVFDWNTFQLVEQCTFATLPADLTDPGPDAQGTPAPRVDLLFRERALWLYLTGHRQGDLRRLVREYGRPSERVYPSGLYQGGIGGVEGTMYGNEVVAPVPPSERQHNPLYEGCFHTNA